MKAVIWDLDGTLIDSYDAIVGGLLDLCKFYKLDFKKKDVYDFVKTKSVFSFEQQLSENLNVPLEVLSKQHTKFCEIRNKEVSLIDGAKEILDYILSKGYLNIVVTSRGTSTDFFLENLQIKDKFIEVITREDKFEKKPNPESMNYLLNKYNLNSNDTFYIGDRDVDIEYGFNSGVKTVMFLEKDSIVRPNPKASFIIDNLLLLKQII